MKITHQRQRWMSQVWTAWIREYKSILGDRGALLVLVAAAVLYALIYPLPYKEQVLRQVPVVVVDQDRTPLSRQLTRMLGATEVVAVAGVVGTMDEARSLLMQREAGGIMVVPQGFSQAVGRGEQAVVTALGDGSYFLTYRQVATAVLSAATTMGAAIEVQGLVARGASLSEAMVQRDPVPLITRMLYDPSGGYASYVVPAVLIIILQQTLLIGLGLLSGAEQEGSVQVTESAMSHESHASWYLWTPSLTASLTGRAMAYLTIYSVHILFFISVIYSLYGFSQKGSIWLIFLFLLPFLLAVIFLGIAISGVFPERETAMQALLFTSLPSVFLAGFSWPPEMLPKWLNTISWLLPSTPGVRGYLRVNQMGASLGEVWHEWVMLWALAAVYLVCALLVARRRRQRAVPSL